MEDVNFIDCANIYKINIIIKTLNFPQFKSYNFPSYLN